MTKEFTMRMPDDIHALLMRIKQQFRISINAKIMGFIMRGLIDEGTYPISKLIEVSKRDQSIIYNETEPIPEGVKFCDGDSCEVEPHMWKDKHLEIQKNGYLKKCPKWCNYEKKVNLGERFLR